MAVKGAQNFGPCLIAQLSQYWFPICGNSSTFPLEVVTIEDAAPLSPRKKYPVGRPIPKLLKLSMNPAPGDATQGDDVAVGCGTGGVGVGYDVAVAIAVAVAAAVTVAIAVAV